MFKTRRGFRPCKITGCHLFVSDRTLQCFSMTSMSFNVFNRREESREVIAGHITVPSLRSGTVVASEQKKPKKAPSVHTWRCTQPTNSTNHARNSGNASPSATDTIASKRLASRLFVDAATVTKTVTTHHAAGDSPLATRIAPNCFGPGQCDRRLQRASQRLKQTNLLVLPVAAEQGRQCNMAAQPAGDQK